MKDVLFEIADILICTVEFILVIPFAVVLILFLTACVGVICILDRLLCGSWDANNIEMLKTALWVTPALLIACISRIKNGQDDIMFHFICDMFDMIREDMREES